LATFRGGVENRRLLKEATEKKEGKGTKRQAATHHLSCRKKTAVGLLRMQKYEGGGKGSTPRGPLLFQRGKGRRCSPFKEEKKGGSPLHLEGESPWKGKTKKKAPLLPFERGGKSLRGGRKGGVFQLKKERKQTGCPGRMKGLVEDQSYDLSPPLPERKKGPKCARRNRASKGSFNRSKSSTSRRRGEEGEPRHCARASNERKETSPSLVGKHLFQRRNAPCVLGEGNSGRDHSTAGDDRGFEQVEKKRKAFWKDSPYLQGRKRWLTTKGRGKKKGQESYTIAPTPTERDLFSC